jgi:adenine phosphoribosyltransferase
MKEAVIKDLIERIRDVPDFPKPGILFKDITPLLSHPPSFKAIIDRLGEVVGPIKPDVIAGIEARGFIFGAPLALALGVPFVPVRKPGKLPYRTVKVSYALEYGHDTLEMHEDAVARSARVVILDDLLATGGTAGGTAKLIEQQGGVVVAFAFAIELGFLGGRGKLLAERTGSQVISLIKYD